MKQLTSPEITKFGPSTLKQSVMGYQVESSSRMDCIAEMADALDYHYGQCRWMACLNVHSYVVAKDDPSYASALRSADWLVPDGIALVWAGRMVGSKITERITGPDIFEGMMAALNERSGSVFFLGSTEANLSRIAEKLSADYPNVRLAGTYSPPFKSEFSNTELDEMIDVIARAKPDVLWVGMTAPKQEKWLLSTKDRLPVKFAGAIGAVFDFYSGRLRRSPKKIQELGLEWLHRLVMQPRRHWRRIFHSIPRFLSDLPKEFFDSRLDKQKK